MRTRAINGGYPLYENKHDTNRSALYINYITLNTICQEQNAK